MLYDQSLDLITDKLTDRIDELESEIAEKDKELDESRALISALQKELEDLKKA